MNAFPRDAVSRSLLVIAAIALVVASTREAFAAVRTLRKADCEVTNWCSLGQENCNDCCGGGAPPEGGGLCYTDDPNVQGCLCY